MCWRNKRKAPGSIRNNEIMSDQCFIGGKEMSNINVEPYIADEDYNNPAMVTDFYEFTMAN